AAPRSTGVPGTPGPPVVEVGPPVVGESPVGPELPLVVVGSVVEPVEPVALPEFVALPEAVAPESVALVMSVAPELPIELDVPLPLAPSVEVSPLESPQATASGDDMRSTLTISNFILKRGARRAPREERGA